MSKQVYVKPGLNPATGKPYILRDEYTKQYIPAEGTSVKWTILTDRRVKRGELLVCDSPESTQAEDTKPQKRLAREKFNADQAEE